MKKIGTHAGALVLSAALAASAAAQTTVLCRTSPEQPAGQQRTALCQGQAGAATMACRFQNGDGLVLFPSQADASGWVPAKAGQEPLSCRPQASAAQSQTVPALPPAASLAGLGSQGLKDALAGTNLAMLAPAAFFDGNVLSRGAVAALPAAGVPAPAGLLKLAAANCTPGVDCPEEKPQPRLKPQAKPRCTPGVDCPEDEPQARPKPQPKCTPGVDCPGDGKEPGGSGRTPLPPNYRPRPSEPPSYFPPYSNAPYDDSRVDVAGYWHKSRDFLGSSVRSAGSWGQTTGSASLRRGGSETGLGQGAAYTARLQSQAQRSVYALYWRYVGRDCHPDYQDQCQGWAIQYRWFYEGVETGGVSLMDVEVGFQDDQKLLPWEKETFELLFDGGRVSLRQADAAFRYQVSGPFIDQQRGKAAFTLTPGARILRAPESSQVGLSLVNEGGQLTLVVDDGRSEFYDGETLEVDVTVKYKKKWYQTDPVVSQGVVQVPVRSGERRRAFRVGASQGSGTYYIKSWRFRRAGSKISSAEWIYRGEGNTVLY